MRRICNAIKIFFLTLFSAQVAEQVADILSRRSLPQPAAAEPTVATEVKKTEPKKPPERKAPVRSEALTLLSTLQREARFIDFLQEKLAGFSNDQIGAVARDVHRDCGKVIERMFAIVPAIQQEEGADAEVPVGFDASRYRLTGNVVGEPPFKGKLVHHGWEATKCDVPAWTGSESAAKIVAPVEVELK